MPGTVNNCSVKFPKEHTPNEKRAHFLDFYESEGAPCPSAPLFRGPCISSSDIVLYVMFYFSMQVSVAAKNALTKCSRAHAVLKDFETQLDDLLNSFEELSSRANLSVKSKRKTWIDIQANKAQVSETRLAAMESLQAVENDSAKIKAAMLW